MEKHSCLGNFARYALQNVLGMLGISFYILADTVFVSHGTGADGLTALNLAIPVYSFIHGTGMMLGMGGATRYSVLKVQGADHRTDCLFAGVLYAAGFFALIYMAAGALCSARIAGLMGADSQVIELTDIYIKTVLIFAPAFLLNDILLCFVRNDGNPGLSMAAMLGGSLFNVVFDYIFIFPWKLGIFGAALATGLSPVVSVLILSGHFFGKNCGFRLRLLRPNMSELFSAALLGTSSFITEISSGAVIMAFNTVILKIQGNMGVAAYGVIANLSLVTTSIYTGIAQGMQPLVSRAYGTNQTETAKQVLRYALTASFAVSCVLYPTIFRFSSVIASVFNSEGNAALDRIAVPGLRLYFWGIFFTGFNIITALFFTSVERAAPAQAISLLRGLALLIPGAFLLSALWGITGVWLAVPLTKAAVSALGMFFFISFFRK